MIVQRIHSLPGPELADALSAFEQHFRYPLGRTRTFRISHGTDYPRFFRAMGKAICFVAVHRNNVSGTLGAAIRRLSLADESVHEVAYFGDLKVAPNARGGRTAIALLRAAQALAVPCVSGAFCVVMDGTRVTPNNYAGRLGIPALEPLARIAVFQVRTSDAVGQSFARVTRTECMACHARWRNGRCTLLDGNPAERSESPAQWVMLPNGAACGCLEDTLKAKRLFDDEGAEIRSAHLSSFAYRNVREGAQLFRAVLPVASQLGFDALFVGIPEPEARDFAAALADPPLAAAPATIFGTGLAPGALWHMNTSEI